MDNYEILEGYLNEEGKFERMPGKRQKKKLEAMLHYLSTKFEVGTQYSEVQVNEIINQYTTFKDPATLRRLMWGSKLIKRKLDGTSYWRE